MALNARNREKARGRSQQLLPGSLVVAYAIGRTGPNPVMIGLAIAGAFLLVSGAISVLTGSVFILGLLPFLVVQHFASPPSAVAVADQGVALLRRSIWTGRPSAVVSKVASTAVHPQTIAGGRVKVVVGTEAIWMTKGEEGHLRTGLSNVMSVARVG